MSNDDQKPKSSRRTILVLVGVVLLFACGACGIITLVLPDAGSNAEVAEREDSAIAVSDDQLAPSTDEPSSTPRPSATPRPTNTPKPTDTPRPTRTPAPTPFPTPPPDPIVLSGSGDAIVELDKWPGPALVHISGNSGSRHFAVINYDAAGTYLDLLANTTDPYDGVRPLDFFDGVLTTRFEVTASGDWQIEVLPLLEHGLWADVPGRVAGSGDAVLLLNGAADTATISGNPDNRHFAVESYGDSVDLLVNTTDPYTGQVLVPPRARILVVSAEGEWAMEFTGR